MEFTSIYLSAIVLGFLGSFHCAGMCGPIALMLSTNQSTNNRIAFLGRMYYNFGRLTSYLMIGLLFGMLGMTFSLYGFQSYLSVISGLILLLFFLFSFSSVFRYKVAQLTSAWQWPFKSVLKRFFISKSPAAQYGIGVINGFLPCGLVYVAATAAIAQGSIQGSMAYMFFFGSGTFPIMILISFTASLCNISFTRLVNKIFPYLSFAMALFLIYRGTFMKVDSECHQQAHPPRMESCTSPMNK
jgi:sulfite exporter TauE/SafE